MGSPSAITATSRGSSISPRRSASSARWSSRRIAADTTAAARYALETPPRVERAWAELGHRASVAERALDLRSEISVLVARRPSGEVRVYPPALNFHERQILAWSVLPAPIDAALARRAEAIARDIASALSLEGILAVEMFVLDDDELLVNELAPRPHNSFHETEVACSTSQFEQIVRAVCDLAARRHARALRPGAIHNLFGDLWLEHDGPPPFERALARPGVRLHLYGKPGPRPGRKMGHLSAVGDTADDAFARVRAAADALVATTNLRGFAWRNTVAASISLLIGSIVLAWYTVRPLPHTHAPPTPTPAPVAAPQAAHRDRRPRRPPRPRVIHDCGRTPRRLGDVQRDVRRTAGSWIGERSRNSARTASICTRLESATGRRSRRRADTSIPSKRAHGFKSQHGPHLGDMPNIYTPAAGKLEFEFIVPDVTLTGPSGLLDADGASIVVHAIGRRLHDRSGGQFRRAHRLRRDHHRL